MLDAFVTYGEGFFATHDGGQSWQAFPTPGFEEDFLYDYDFVNATTGWVITDSYDEGTKLWLTVDGGATWERLTPVISR